MDNSVFTLLRQPRVIFGPGRLQELPDLTAGFGRHVLVLTGVSTLSKSGVLSSLFDQFRSRSLQYDHLTVSMEPHPQLIDKAVSRYGEPGVDVVVAIGGGSVMDAGKAVSAMLLKKEPVERYIEGHENFIPHDGRKVPFIAVPTTSGTGSEATSNAVISSIGKNGFKRSLRHPALVPEIALIDPRLMLSLSPELTAASGMDAFTQLLEAYLSPSSSPYTDALAWSGLEHFHRSFLAACSDGAGDVNVRADIAYATLMSGMALANAGLGVVHGFASSIGGYIDIPHGTLCATLLCSSTKENISRLRDVGRTSPALEKYGRAGRLFSCRPGLDTDASCDALIDILQSWQDRLQFPRLSQYGICRNDLDLIVERTRSKNNPVQLNHVSLKNILNERL